MRIAFYASRATWRQFWRISAVVALVGGLLGTVALGALAGARRTDSAYGRYLRSVNASDVLVDIPGPLLPVIKEVEREPGTLSAGAWLGLDAQPVIDGREDDSFQTDALTGSLDGEFYRQDKMTVLSGRLPPPSATGELILTPAMARAFHLTVGDHMTWEFYQSKLVHGLPTDIQPTKVGRISFRVAAIADVPPALGDQFDEAPTAILPPAATARFLNGEWDFAWVALRLSDGDAGVPALTGQLRRLATGLTRQYGLPQGLAFTIRRLAIVKHEAQQAIEPQALALAVLGGLAALSMLVLMAQGLTHLLTRSAAGAASLRAMGASRAEAAAAAAGWGAAAVLGAVLISVAGSIAVSPLAPVGPVRRYDPARGPQADGLVLAAGGAALLALLTAMLAWLAWRAVRQERGAPAARPSVVVAAASRAGLPVTAISGLRHALERGSGRLRAPVRATLTGSIVAVAALVTVLVFGASLTGLVAHPREYGWNWAVLIQSQGGWGNLPPASMANLVSDQPGVTGWSEFGFGQVSILDAEVPVMGILRQSGAVAPPTTSGRPLSAGAAGSDQIALGRVTMRQLGLGIGDSVRIGYDKQPLTVVGTVTMPSFGVVLTDHVSLGRGALMDESTLLKVLGFPPLATAERAESGRAESSPAYPATAAFDVSSPAAAHALVARIIKAEPDHTAGGIYQLQAPLELGAPVADASQMGSQPLALAAGVAAAAVLALALTILASVRQRRRELALLKALGLRAAQIRAVIAWQTSTILVVAAIVGVPAGLAAGRWAWTSFANSIGVVPAPVVPASALAVGVAALFLTGNLLAFGPARTAARIAPAVTFRTE
jgi:ABC-type lipoprotein release transport system permease subunit